MDATWPPMPPGEFTLRMRELCLPGDPGGVNPSEPATGSRDAAEGLMFGVLRSLGYGEGVDVFRAAHYAPATGIGVQPKKGG